MCALTEQWRLVRTLSFGRSGVSVVRSRRPHVHAIFCAVLFDQRQSHRVENVEQLHVLS